MNNDEQEDFSLYRDDVRFDESKLGTIVEDANLILELEKEIDNLEASLTATKLRLKRVQTETLPEKMKAAGIADFTLPSGWNIELRMRVQGSLPLGDSSKRGDPARRAEALATLRKLGGEEIIKNSITVVFDRGKDNIAKEAVEILKQYGFDPKVKEDVHAMTLQAWGREQLNEVSDVGQFITEAEKIGLFIGNVAKVKRST